METLSRSLEAYILARQAIEIELRKSRNEAHDLAKELEILTWVDGLTGIANRRQLDRALEREWGRATRECQSLALFMIDVDFFKQFNDIYLLQAGDACLRQLAALLKSACQRPSDLIARYGGEEFAVLLPDTTLESAVEIAESIRIALVNLAIPHTDSNISNNSVTASFGVAAVIPHANITQVDLIKNTDQALYLAKKHGRNSVKTTHLKEADARDGL